MVCEVLEFHKFSMARLQVDDVKFSITGHLNLIGNEGNVIMAACDRLRPIH